jgi:uncharacterized membrane protein HdeD (DUF308 family)
MKNENEMTVQRTTRNWWASVIIGILAIVLGVWCLAMPGSSLVAMTVIFIITFLLSGCFEIWFAIANRGTDGWGWSLAGGVLDLLIGILLAVLPVPTITVVLIWFIGFWLMLRSIIGIRMVSKLRKWGMKEWGGPIAAAVLGSIAALLFLISPTFGGIMIVLFAGCGFILYGVFRIWLGIKLRKINNEAK